jgi:uncharacterized membrane protein
MVWQVTLASEVGPLMRRLTPFAVFVLGIACATVLAGVTSLFMRSGWIILPIVLGSALGTTLLMIRQWNQRPRQKPADSEQRRRSWAEIALQNAMAIVYSVGFVALTIGTAATTKPLCACLTLQNFVSWLTTTVLSAMLTFLLILGFIAVYVTVRESTNR